MGAATFTTEPLTALVWTAALVFARVGALVMFLPGLGETGVPPRLRLSLALLLTLAIGPLVAASAPALPEHPAAMAIMLGREVLIGLAVGSLARMFMAALQVAGNVIGMQSGLALAQTFDPSSGQQNAIFASFLSIAGLALLFTTDTHHLFIVAIRGLYESLPIGAPLPVGDLADAGASAVGEVFALGLRLAAPIIVFGLVFYVGMGVLSRLMPQAQVFFIAMPATVMASLAILAMTLGGVMLIYIERLADAARDLG